MNRRRFPRPEPLLERVLVPALLGLFAAAAFVLTTKPPGTAPAPAPSPLAPRPSPQSLSTRRGAAPNLQAPSAGLNTGADDTSRLLAAFFRTNSLAPLPAPTNQCPSGNPQSAIRNPQL